MVSAMDDLFGLPEPTREQVLEQRIAELELALGKANDAVVGLIDTCSDQYREIARLKRKVGEPVSSDHLPAWYREKDWRSSRKPRT